MLKFDPELLAAAQESTDPGIQPANTACNAVTYAGAEPAVSPQFTPDGANDEYQ